MKNKSIHLVLSYLAMNFINLSPASACVFNSKGERLCIGDITSVNSIEASVIDINENTGEVHLQLSVNNFTTLADCRAESRYYPGNPHRNRDAHFRACKQKAIELKMGGEAYSACVAYCMKN